MRKQLAFAPDNQLGDGDILRRVDGPVRAAPVIDNGDADRHAVLQRAKLLQPLGLFERRGRKLDIAGERGLAVSVKADMAVNAGVAFLAHIRNDGLGEIERVLLPVEDNRGAARGRRLLLRQELLKRLPFEPHGRSDDIGRAVEDHLVDHRLQHPGRRQRRVALQIENDIFLDRGPLHRVVHALGAVAAIGRGHDGFRIEAARGGKDALVVRRDHDAGCLGDAFRDAPDALQHGRSGDRVKRLSRKARRGIARGDDDGC